MQVDSSSRPLIASEAGPRRARWQILLATLLALAGLASLVPSPAIAGTTVATSWTQCANEGWTAANTCTLPPALAKTGTHVRFGANGVFSTTFVYGAIACNHAVFGDPAPGVPKACEYATESFVPGPATTDSPSPVATQPASGAPPGPGVYVDARFGNDAADGSFARPWKTLARAQKAALAAGAGFYLRCGTTFRETLSLSTAQLQNGAIVAGYGDCAKSKAVISGADDVSGGWSKSGNIWSRRVPATMGKIRQLFIDGVRQRTAQWPNFGGLGREYAIAGASTGDTTSIIVGAADLATLASRDLIGATLMVKNTAYTVGRMNVVSFDRLSGRIVSSIAGQYVPTAGVGYLLSDRPWMLDAPGEFFHDQANGMLYAYPGTPARQADLNAATVEGTVRAVALSLSLRAGLSVRHIAAVKAAEVGFYLSNAAAALVDGVDVSDNLRYGLRIDRSSENTLIRRSSFGRNGYMAVDFATVAAVTFSGNSVADTGVLAYSGPAAVAVASGPGARVSKNIVQRSAYNGINWSGAGGSRISGNFIGDSCLRFGDGAALYSWNGRNDLVNQSSTVEGNIIVRATGNADGAGKSPAADICMGIYADELSRFVEIRDNTVIDVPIGIYLHNTSSTTVASNRVWLARKGGLWLNATHSDPQASAGTVFRQNQVNVALPLIGSLPAPLTAGGTAQPFWYWHRLSGVKAIANGEIAFVGNQVLMLNGSAAPAAWFHGQDGDYKMTIDGWRKLNPEEAAPLGSMSYLGYVGSLPPRVADYASAVYAAPDTARLIDCAALGWPAGCTVRDTAGHPVALPLSLPAGTARLLLRVDTSARTQ